MPMEEIEATVCMDWECGYEECSAKEKNNLDSVLRELANQARNTSAACPPRSRKTSEKRHSESLLKRLFSRESSRDLLARNYRKCSSLNDKESCKVS